MIILEIIGGIVLCLLFIAATIYIYYRIKFGKLFNLDTSDLEPLTVHLNEDISPDWINKEKPKASLSELESIGYIKGKPYSVYETDDCFLMHLHQEQYCAVACTHPIAGFWVDIVIEEVNGKQYTFTSCPLGEGLDMRPDSEKKFLPKASASELHSLARDLVDNKDRQFKDLSAVDFREYFEESHRKDMMWKNRKGGISFEEFQKVEHLAKFRTKKKKIGEAFKQLKLDELNQWHEVALEDYRKEHNISEEDWYDIEYRMFIVPFHTYAPAFVEYLQEQDFLKESDISKLQTTLSNNTEIPVLFESINARLSPELRSTLVAESTFPLQLNIYKLSEKMIN
ncbi:MAG: hypothetical protein ABW098_03185 [Candidatus Thiodiazotropha sp.]